jgi:hypothetical protein
MVKRRWALGLALTLAGPGLLACGDDNGNGPNDNPLSQLAGTYTATQFVFRSVADPNTTFDLVADAGASFDLSIQANGDYTLVGSLPGFPDQTEQGTVEIDGDQITLNSDDTSSGTFDLDGSTLTIDLTSGAEFDFDGDATDEPATVHIVFEGT